MAEAPRVQLAEDEPEQFCRQLQQREPVLVRGARSLRRHTACVRPECRPSDHTLPKTAPLHGALSWEGRGLVPPIGVCQGRPSRLAEMLGFQVCLNSCSSSLRLDVREFASRGSDP
jgi:hypothetical protein